LNRIDSQGNPGMAGGGYATAVARAASR
jgi:hypothetical protein